MTSGWIIFFEIALVLGLALVFGVREIVNLRKFNRERAARNAADKQVRRANPPDAAS